jgi:hypothetical protein
MSQKSYRDLGLFVIQWTWLLLLLLWVQQMHPLEHVADSITTIHFSTRSSAHLGAGRSAVAF